MKTDQQPLHVGRVLSCQSVLSKTIVNLRGNFILPNICGTYRAYSISSLLLLPPHKPKGTGSIPGCDTNVFS